MEAFRKIELEKFVQKSVIFLRENFTDWSADKEQKGIEVFIYEIFEFSEQYEIRKQLNLQKLMYLKIEFGFEMPLVKEFEDILGEVEQNESYRVKCFNKILLNKEIPEKREKLENDLDWLN